MPKSSRAVLAVGANVEIAAVEVAVEDPVDQAPSMKPIMLARTIAWVSTPCSS